MAIMKKSDQLLYTGRGPLDAKSLVKTYAELLNTTTWTTQVNGTDTFVAYNGMTVAVWLNKDDTAKNGIYLLYDPLVTSAVKKPDVANEANWHKLTSTDDIDSIITQVDAIKNTDIPAAILEAKAYTDSQIAKIPVPPIATLDIPGLVKASDEIAIDIDGTLGINYVSTDKLVQGTEPLTLSCGSAG